ncbi:MAG: nucleotide exchange factor GrpE, partial [Candidatus Omnitrophica bacterium]|nr:nucleotide exchange factor GrpE [Candidatus Omnitrophota bacterium]
KVSNDKFGDGVVAEEVRKGYMLNGKVLRPAMVKVTYKEEVQNG